MTIPHAFPFKYDMPVSDDGETTGIDVHRHLTDTQVEEVLWHIESAPEDFGLEEECSRTLAVTHVHRWNRPVDEDEDTDFDHYYEYSSKPVPNSVPITRFEYDAWGWDSPNCAYHPDRPSDTGLSEYLWPEDGAQRATTDYPGKKHEHKYLYVCRECSNHLHEAHKVRNAGFLEMLHRVQGFGLPANLIRLSTYPSQGMNQ